MPTKARGSTRTAATARMRWRRRIRVLRRDYPLNERNLDWWVNEKDSPYTEVKRFDWYRGYHVGGRSLLWGRQSYRWSDFDFEANARDGIAVDWPLRYAELAPWYDYVERHAGIAGSIEGMRAIAGRPIPAGDAAQLRRGARRGPRARLVRRPPAHHPGPRREPDAAAARPLAVPVPQRVLARLPVWRLLQHAIFDAAGRDGDGKAHAEAVLDRDRGALRQGPAARDRRARARRRRPSRRRSTRRASCSSVRRR